MRARNDQAIVIAGYWNRMIFTPEWVGEKLFEGADQVEAQVPILPVDPIIYKNDTIELKVSGGRLVFRTLNPDIGSLWALESVVRIVLKELNDTPVTAIGINFSFEEKNPTKELKACFEFPDEANAKKAGWRSTELRIVRHFEKSEQKLIFIAAKTSDGFRLDLNFHRDSKTNVGTEIALECIREGIDTYWNASLDFLKRIYNLRLEEAATDGQN